MQEGTGDTQKITSNHSCPRSSLIPDKLLRTARDRPAFLAIYDSNGTSLSVSELVNQANLFAREIQVRSDGMTYIGLLFPTSALAAVATLAVLTAGKVPVFLNYTLPFDSVHYAISKCQIDLVISSREFVNTLSFSFDTAFLFIEDIFDSQKRPHSGFNSTMAEPTLRQNESGLGTKSLSKFQGKEKTSFSAACPSELRDTSGNSFVNSGMSNLLNRTATVVFSSGSTGMPKGIVLSHHNLNSNVLSMLQALKLEEDDCIMGSLPFFHSFGLMTTFWLPLYNTTPVVYHANPLDTTTIGKLVEKHRCTILFATPTFLQAYIRKCPEEQFSSLRIVVTGAEKLHQQIADRFSTNSGSCRWKAMAVPNYLLLFQLICLNCQRTLGKNAVNPVPSAGLCQTSPLKLWIRTMEQS